MKNQRFAPTLILILVIFFILVYAGSLMLLFIKEGLGTFWTLILAIGPLIIIIALISVYRERIKEIDEQEKEDLSKY